MADGYLTNHYRHREEIDRIAVNKFWILFSGGVKVAVLGALAVLDPELLNLIEDSQFTGRDKLKHGMTVIVVRPSRLLNSWRCGI